MRSRSCWRGLLPILLTGLLLIPGVAVGDGEVAGPGLYVTQLYADSPLLVPDTPSLGTLSVWNSPKNFHIKIQARAGWALRNLHLFVDTDISYLPDTKSGNPKLGHFPYKEEFGGTAAQYDLVIPFEELPSGELDKFFWGSDDRDRVVVAHVCLVDLNDPNAQEVSTWAYGAQQIVSRANREDRWWFNYQLAHPRRGQFIDAPVQGLSYQGPTQEGVTGVGETGDQGGFLFFPDERITFSVGTVPLGALTAAKKVSPLDLFPGEDVNGARVTGVARVLQTLDLDRSDGRIDLAPEMIANLGSAVQSRSLPEVDYGDPALVTSLLEEVVARYNSDHGANLTVVSAAEAQAKLEAGLNASGIFRKNVSKTEDWGETKQKLDVMPVYVPGVRSNGDPSLCVDANGDGYYDEVEDQLGVPYQEWRLAGCDPTAADDYCRCDPRIDSDDNGQADGEQGLCTLELVECREVAKPLVVTYLEKIDIYDDQVTTEFWPGRFAWDTFTAVSRDDGTTWKRMNVSRMADQSSFELETGEPFPGTSGSPYLKINDNYVLVVWESKFCKSGNPRYSITDCVRHPEDCTDQDGDGVAESVCRGNPDEGTEVCEPDYTGDDPYYVTDIWGVRGAQQSVDYDEVDDVADLGIGEIPYSCLWAARGVIVTQRELGDGTFASLTVEDDPTTDASQCTDAGVPFVCCTGAGTGDCDETKGVDLGDIVWFKPERITSGRRDVYIPVVGSARGAGFAIAWQEDPTGLRPGKGKGPGEGWSGAISNHKSDIWYAFLPYDAFAVVDAEFVPGGDPDPDRPGLGRPKALVPFSLPVRVSDNDMVNTHTLKVEPSATCVTPPGGTEPVCFPEVDPATGSFVPIDPDEIAKEFCGHPEADPATCCDPDDHEGDPNCEDLKGLFGNLNGTKRYAYLARTVDDDADGVPDYQYYVDRGGTLDLCDTSGDNSYMDELPGTSLHERWYGFTNSALASKLVCVTSDGRLLDGDVSASRPMLQLQPYTRADGTKSAWALLAYEESKGMGHSLAAEAHDQETENPVDEILEENKGQDKPIKQDIGKNLLYHSFDFAQPDLVAPGHMVNLPALCGGLYPNYCGDDYSGTNPTCTCEPGLPVPLYYDYLVDADGDPVTPDEWMPDTTKLLQFRTEIARRARFIVQSKGKMGPSRTLGALIYKQGQEGQGRPADVFIRRIVSPVGDTGNPYKYENFECTTYLDQTFALPACPNGAGDKPSATGYNCNVWGEAAGDRLCGGIFTDPYPRRDHVNLTSHDIDYSVGVPVDDTPDDPTDDVYSRDKVLLWSQHEYNLGDESFGAQDGVGGLAGMFSNARSHRGFIRGDFFATAYSMSPNWAAGRNGNDRYNFYVRRSFDGGQTWTTTPSDLGGEGIHFCREWRTDPYTPDDDGTGNAPPPADVVDPLFDPECVAWCPPCEEDPNTPEDDCACEVTGEPIAAGAFEPARNVSEIGNNKESSGDPRIGTTPPTYPLNGEVSPMANLCPTGPGSCTYIEDEYVDNVFFVAWGTVDNPKSTGSEGVKPEGAPLDLYYTRTENYGDHYLKIPWVVNGDNSNFAGETVWRYQRLAWGEPEEQGECQLRATADGSKVYAIYHSSIPEEEDPDEVYTRWYPWKPEHSYENDLWYRRVIFWPDEITAPPATAP